MVNLEPLLPKDFSLLIQWTDTPMFLLQWAGPGFRFPLTREQLLEHWEGTRGEDPSRRCFKAVHPETGQMVGHIELNRINRTHRSATISRVLLDPQVQGGGLGTAMVQEVARVGFEEMNLHRIDLYDFDFNDSAIACYERVGFRMEGKLRDARRIDDRYWTVCIMGMLEQEWRERRDAISKRSTLGSGS
ncbi:GNAT family N-acetyltransferase [Salinithrix halophila]|uniref:GNAT family N-acetyltransferase n=1 Tax=Salinithrix halophila TaxID=1485204 RepID=A0ABV8JEE3_9BACL